MGIVVEEVSGALKGITNEHVSTTFVNTVQLGTGGHSDIRPVGVVSKSLRGPNEDSTRSVDCARIDVNTAQVTNVLENAVRDFSHSPNPPLVDTNVDILYADRHIEGQDTVLQAVKFGAATGVSMSGTIQGTANTEVTILGTDFPGVMLVEGENSFNPPGESGTALLLKTKKSNGDPVFVVAGIIFAQLDGNNKVGVACHFVDVMLALELDIPPASRISDWSQLESASNW